MEIVEWSNSEAERKGTPLLVMLHGYGSSEKRMSALFDAMPNGFTCAAPRAPKDISGDYGWFLLDYFLNNDFADVIAAATGVLAWVDQVKEKYSFSSVSLMGFSQGMAMATTLLRLRPDAFSAVVGLSGFVIHNELLAASEPLAAQRPFLWAHDPADLVINPDATEFTAEWLAQNTELSQAFYEDLGHNIGPTELKDVSSFLTGHVAGASQPRS